MRREVSCWAVAMMRMPRRRVMPPVGERSQLRRDEQERGKVSISDRRDMEGEISPPLNARRFMVRING